MSVDNNNGGPAFPDVVRLQMTRSATLNAEQREQIYIDSKGMSLRAWFATHAPREIPAWFEHKPVRVPIPPNPNRLDLPTKEQQDAALEWLCEAADLPPELEWFGKAHRDHLEAKLKAHNANAIARYIQWPWHYADLMLSEIDK